VSVIRQYLEAGQIDEMLLAVSPVLLGEGEHLFYLPESTSPNLASGLSGPSLEKMQLTLLSEEVESCEQNA
jgi:riboflavin biosynthesis pyrimidine reductase